MPSGPFLLRHELTVYLVVYDRTAWQMAWPQFPELVAEGPEAANGAEKSKKFPVLPGATDS